MPRLFALLLSTILISSCLLAQENPAFSKQDIIYGYKDGLALTMLMLKPQKPNGKAIISMVSGNWVSAPEGKAGLTARAMPFVSGGYTVFLTMHGSAPRYSIPEAFKDVQRAVQYVRFNASTYGIDVDHIGITGASSGGHLSLLAATAEDAKAPASKDPVDRVSSKVQAAAVFFPPTDFLNWGMQGFNSSSQKAILQRFDVLGAFEFKEWDSVKHVYASISDKGEKYMQMAKAASPAQLVTADDAPVYMIHGDKDLTVPLQQSQEMEHKLKAANIPVMLTIKPGEGHGWKGMNDDETEFVKWFDKYLRTTVGTH